MIFRAFRSTGLDFSQNVLEPVKLSVFKSRIVHLLADQKILESVRKTSQFEKYGQKIIDLS